MDKIITSCVGKKIVGLQIEKEEELIFTFEGGTILALKDDAQCCCEHRFMHTDDDLDYYVGSTLIDVRVEDGPTVEESKWDDVTESQFLKVTTSKGVFTIVNYNEHNGYYGGFGIVASIK